MRAYAVLSRTDSAEDRLPSLAQQAARARKLVAVLREPRYRRALRYGVAASVEHEAIPLCREFQTVIDAGANRGQFAVFAARRFPDAALICFEPLPEPGARLRRAVGNLGRLKLWDVALGAANEEAEFHVSAADDSSSLLPIGERQREAFPGTGSVRPQGFRFGVSTTFSSPAS